MPSLAAKFNSILWEQDRVRIGDTEIALHDFTAATPSTDACLLYKTKFLMDQYARFFSQREPHAFRNILEVGIWGYGSVVLWNELLRPEKYVAIDINKSTRNSGFESYVGRNEIAHKVKTLWEFDQGDKTKLQNLCDAEFPNGLDLVIDDGSHLYRYTRPCLEALLPRLNEGGLYIIEDWAWEHWKSYDSLLHPWATEESLTKLVHELVCTAGSANELIQDIYVCKGFVAIQRGGLRVPSVNGFKLDTYSQRRRFKFLRSAIFPFLPSILGVKRQLKKLSSWG